MIAVASFHLKEEVAKSVQHIMSLCIASQIHFPTLCSLSNLQAGCRKNIYLTQGNRFHMRCNTSKLIIAATALSDLEEGWAKTRVHFFILPLCDVIPCPHEASHPFTVDEAVE